MEEKETLIELKSEPMNEMLSNPPSWITRSGSGLVLFILCLIAFISWFIRYPDEVTGEVVVAGSKAPIELSNQRYVQLKALNVSENQQVSQGELIAQFDFKVHAEDFAKAAAYLEKLQEFKGEFPATIPLAEEELQLGTFREQWTGLLSKIREWNSEYGVNFREEELRLIRREIAFREQLQAISGTKIRLSESEYALLEEHVSGSQRLSEQQAISKHTLTQDKRAQNQAMQLVQGQKEQHLQNLIALNELKKEQLHLEHDARLERIQRSAGIQLALSGLARAFQNWKEDAVWTAPCSGKIVFNKLLQVNRFYKADEASIVLVPQNGTYEAVAVIPAAGAGKLRAGQKAFVELTDYPKAEFGMLEGTVSRLTQIDKGGKYEVGIALPNTLKTTHGKEIPPRARLMGNVKIVTKDKRLLLRFFEQLTELI